MKQLKVKNKLWEHLPPFQTVVGCCSLQGSYSRLLQPAIAGLQRGGSINRRIKRRYLLTANWSGGKYYRRAVARLLKRR